MAKLFADENFHGGVSAELCRLGHDVVTAQQAGLANRMIPDDQVLAYAVQQGRAVLTHDRWHFVRLHRQTPQHFGILICTDDKDVLALAHRIHQSLLSWPNLTNQLLRVNRPPKP